MLIKIIFCILLSVGLWLLALDIFKVPYIKTSKAVKNLLSKRKVKENAAELWLSGLSKVLAQHIRINEYAPTELKVVRSAVTADNGQTDGQLNLFDLLAS